MNFVYRWRDPSGAHTELCLSERPAAEADAIARLCGWPGHSGATCWRYAADALQGLVRSALDGMLAWHRQALADRADWESAWSAGFAAWPVFEV